MKTLGPNFSRRVRAATAASVVIGSGTGSGEDRRSENQTESISVVSHSSTSCQRNPAPSDPAAMAPA